MLIIPIAITKVDAHLVIVSKMLLDCIKCYYAINSAGTGDTPFVRNTAFYW